MITQTIRTVPWTFVTETEPTKRGAIYSRFVIRNDTNRWVRALVTFTPPARKGTVYSSVKLKFYNSVAIPGTHTIAVEKVVSGWSVAKTNWNNKPNYTITGSKQVAKTAAPKHSLYEFDITDWMNAVSAGAVWYGFQIRAVEALTQSATFEGHKVPTWGMFVEASWSDAPETPKDLNPSGGRAVSIAKPVLRSDFVDKNGNTEINGIQVQINDVDNFVTGIDFDSGDVPVTSPQLDLATTAYAGVPASATRYWRVRVKDGDGNWSGWSASTSFKNLAKGVVTIVSPGVAPNNYVEETSPPILWSYSGVQRSYQILVYNLSKTKVLADTGKQTSVDTGVSLPTGTYFKDNENYIVEVRIWDNNERATTPGDPSYSIATRQFFYNLSSGVTPTTNLVLSRVGQTPWIQLNFNRTTVPDYFDVFRDGEVIFSSLLSAEAFISGTSYQIVDRLARPRMPHTYEVRPKVNGVTASGNATATLTVKPTTAFLCTVDGEIAIPLVNYAPSIEKFDGSTTYQIMNSDEPVTVYQGEGGYEGDFSGVISSAVQQGVGTSVDYLRQFDLLGLEENQGRLCALSYADRMIPCVISKLSSVPTVWSEEIGYLATFHLTERKRVTQ